MDATAVLERLSALGVTITPRPNGNLWLEPATKIPYDVLEMVRQHKAEILAALRKPRLVAGPPEWHAKEVERLVLKEGCCIFWVDLFQELVAFIKDETYRKEVPKGIAVFTDGEIKLLFPDDGRDVSEHTLRLIHMAKKLAGLNVTDVRDDQ